MMISKYFKQGQKLLLRTLHPEGGKFEALTVFFRDNGPDYFELQLPYGARGSEAFPFHPDMSFEILSDAMGLSRRYSW